MGITLNPIKSEFLIFHSRLRQFPLYINEIMINEFIVERLTTTKFLGVHFEENLTWKTHLTSINKKTLHISSVNLIQKKIGFEIFRFLYKELVYPSFNHCKTIWGTASNVRLRNAITNQKLFLRLMFSPDR